MATGLLAMSSAASAATEVGVYQDNPVRTLPAFVKTVGAPRVLSVYVTGGERLDPAVVALAKKRRLRLMVSWMPDAGRPGRGNARVGIRGVNAGRYDTSLRELTVQIRGLRPAPLLRPMPEMNTPWYAWSGSVRGNTPAAYIRAWVRVRKIVRATGRGKVRLMWAPYSRSIPDRSTNAIALWFPGVDRVDAVGVSGYNFGEQGSLAWTGPRALFADAYRQIKPLAPDAPFWIAETASASRGGDAATWIRELSTLPAAFPGLAGIVWFDVKEPNGDFRITANRNRVAAFRELVRVTR